MSGADELIARAKAAVRRRRLDEAAELYWRALEAFDASGQPMRAAHIARHLAEVEMEAGRLEEASLRIAAVLLFYRGRQVRRLEMADTLRIAALIDEKRGFRDEARQLWGEVREMYAREGVEEGVAEARKRLVRLANA